MTKKIWNSIEKYKDYVVATRRFLHQNPEISNNEFHTTEFIAKELEKIGVNYARPTKTGLVATIEGLKGSGKTIGLRADIDALPVLETNELPYASKNKGVMHACGHDGHTAALLTAAHILQRQRKEFSGKVKLFFQPAEEKGPSGAQGFLNNGALSGIDGMMGLHLWNYMPTGTFSAEAGVRMATAARVKIHVKGKGGHGARPHLGIDAVVVASAIIMNLQSLVSRELDFFDSAIVSIGKLTAGTEFNVLASEAEMEGTIKFFDASLNKQLETSIRRIVEKTAETYRASATVEYISRGDLATPLINDERMSRIGQKAISKLFGSDSLIHVQPSPGSEDFSRYQYACPVFFAFIGAGGDGSVVYSEHHSPDFNFDEKALPMAAAVYVQYALEFLHT